MEGIIYIAHGSKMPDKNAKFRAFTSEIMKSRPEPLQRTAFLEKDDENVPLVISQMIDDGLTRLTVMPMLLFPAMHAVEDIPAQVSDSLKDTDIPYKIADCFGMHPAVYETALERIDDYDADIYLITAHGNKRFPEPDIRLKQTVEQMQQNTDKNLVTAMLYGELNFRKLLNDIPKEKKIVIMPYFLFDGHLVVKIKRLSQKFIEEGWNIAFTETLDLNMNMTEAVLDKLKEIDNEVIANVPDNA